MTKIAKRYSMCNIKTSHQGKKFQPINQYNANINEVQTSVQQQRGGIAILEIQL